LQGQLIAMALGILGSLAVHISKGIQKQVFLLYNKGYRKRTLTSLYTFGFLLNNTFGLIMIPAMRFAPPSYFSSMFGVGLLALLLYGQLFLNEQINRQEVIGAVILTLGTLILGADNVIRRSPSFHLISQQGFLSSALGGVLFLGSLVVFFRHFPVSIYKAFIFGAFSGFLNGMDPLLKALGQSSPQGMHLLPVNLLGWIIFGASFIAGTMAFLMTQYSFKKKIPASLVIPVHNVFFILTPLLMQSLWLPGFLFTPLAGLGVLTIVGGLVLMKWGANKKIKRP